MEEKRRKREAMDAERRKKNPEASKKKDLNPQGVSYEFALTWYNSTWCCPKSLAITKTKCTIAAAVVADIVFVNCGKKNN